MPAVPFFRPPTGNHFKLTEKIRIKISPIQKTGIPCAIIGIILIKWSAMPSLCVAAVNERSSDITIEIVIDMTTSKSVTGAYCKIRLRHDTPYLIELPVSACKNTFCRKMRNCCPSESFKCSCSLN